VTEGLLAEGYRTVGFDIERHVYGEARYPAQLVLQDNRVWAAETAVEEGVNAVDISFEAASQQRLVVLK
jgi:hypothetical protein